MENRKSKMSKLLETRGFQYTQSDDFQGRPLQVVSFALHSISFHTDVEQWLSD